MPTFDWLPALIEALQTLQQWVLQALAAVRVVETIDGQPAWPFASRLSGENLVFDLPQARRLGLSVVCAATALILGSLALIWRRRRLPLLALGLLSLLAAPWPEPGVITAAAHPTSLHRSPTGFSASAIVAGESHYAQHCSGCHGATGRGDGPLARHQPVWPPDFIGPLLWRRADGDLFWHIRHGVVDRHGQQTMPGFAERLRDEEIWQLIDYLKALSAGQSLKLSGKWSQPVALPRTAIDCGDGESPSNARPWRGQRLRIVADARDWPIEDPRLVTIALAPSAVDPRAVGPRGADPAAADRHAAEPSTEPGVQPGDCVLRDPDARRALSIIAGGTLEARQLIVDRAGWLRAISQPGQRDWTLDDLVCRSPTASAAPASLSASASPRGATDVLGTLIATIDAEPVRFLKGGFIH